MNNGRVHNRPRGDADAPALQILVHRVQHRPAQFVFLQKVTELKDGALVRHRGARSGDAPDTQGKCCNFQVKTSLSPSVCRFVLNLPKRKGGR